LWDLYKEGSARDTLNTDQISLVNGINGNMSSALLQLAAGLHHLHSLRIIHRDIKPQNILVAYPKKNQKGGPRFVISDFGLCRTLPDNVSTLVGTMGNAGTIGWKAPELIGQPRNNSGGHSSTANDSTSSTETVSQGVKRAVDIFSLGCVFFYVLTNGSHPFDREDSEVGHVERELNIKKNISNFGKLRQWAQDAEEPMQLIEWMLSPRPEDRPTAHMVLNHPFFWSDAKRLNFLCDVSDHWERECRDPPSPHLQILENIAANRNVHKGNFLGKLDKMFIDTLGKQRKYTGDRMLDLLRALRNKKNHYADMDEVVKRRVGELPSGYLKYWTFRFPNLLMACYDAVRECGLEGEPRFREYLEGGVD
jgi:serine/threonine-protein kinase/endoribonuclease IRE1